jgi:sortase A
MSLTIKALGISGAPVRSSGSQRALDNGVIHEPDTSLPWDEGVQRNVYLVGHRLGWPGTGSHRIFYDLDKLATGDRIVLRDSRGHSFEYRVTDSLLVGPEDSWVKDVVPGRDMVSLQTCTPIPTFEKRLIVRADRV